MICAPHGKVTGTPEAALDCAGGHYLNAVTTWTEGMDDIKQNSHENF